MKAARSIVILTITFFTVSCSNVTTKSGASTNAGSLPWNMNDPPVLACITPDDVAQASTKLPGDLKQGQHVIAWATPGSRIIYNGRELAVAHDGRFEFDILYNAPNLLKLTVIPDGQPPGTARFWVYPASHLAQSTNTVSPSQLASGWTKMHSC